YGNDWSQRIVSPSFSSSTYPNARLTFDASIKQENGNPIQSTISPSQEFFTVQALTSAGLWTSLFTRFTTATNQFNAKFVTGRGVVHCEVRTGEDGNQLLGLMPNTNKFRIVVQTNASNSNEDGGVSFDEGAAWIDGLSITNVADNAVISPLVDF